MPHVTIKCYKGRTDEVKQKCVDKVAQDVAELMGCDIPYLRLPVFLVVFLNGYGNG